MGKKQKGSKVEAKVAKSDPPKIESNKKKFKKDKKNKQPKNVNGEKDFQIKSPKDSPTTENNSKKKKFKKDKKNQQQENLNEEKDLQIKKNIQANPQLLKQELEVFVKNLNKEAKLQDYFVKKDEDVSGNFFLKWQFDEELGSKSLISIFQSMYSVVQNVLYSLQFSFSFSGCTKSIKTCNIP